MTRLIDADALILQMESDANQMEDPIAIMFTYAAINDIKHAPTVEAEPVRHGYWIGGELGECSVCGHHGCASDIWNGCTNQYCPNCGAKMDGEVEHEAD